LLAAIARLRFHDPTPIQEKTIPIAISGKDVIGVAQTGTGKTLAFGLPMIQRIGQGHGRGLVIVPTRELAQQVDTHLQAVGRSLGLRTTVLIGGESMAKQTRQIAAKPHAIIATPGRLLDHCDQKTVHLDDVHILVLDEADRMLDMGFAPQITKILARVPRDRQTMLFSATMPQQIMRMASAHMRLPVRIEVAPSGTAAERVAHELFIVPKNQKLALLEKLLTTYTGTVLVFTRTKHGAKKLARQVSHAGHRAAEIHSNRSLNQRREALEGFKRGTYRVLIATDIAARGIDVIGIEVVINYDLPQNAEDYVHRIGRTGRAGREGRAISFAMPDQRRDVRDIERLIRSEIAVTALPELPQSTQNALRDRGHETREYRRRPPRGRFPRQHSGSSSHHGFGRRRASRSRNPQKRHRRFFGPEA
jgi:ATP-dependent RNA helicase RhlE